MFLQDYVIPLVRYDEGIVQTVLGTAFIVAFRDMRLVITAGHVVDHGIRNEWEFGALYKLTSGELHYASASGFIRSKRHDLAACPLTDFVDGLPSGALALGDPGFPLSQDLCTFEYSRSSSMRIPNDPLPALAVTPYFHKGHATRRFLEPPMESNGEPRMELSFPALQGASGAPVLNVEDNSVVGVIVSNHEQQLMPAQVIRVETGAEAVEEVSYFLPMAVALDVRALRDFLENEDPRECLVECTVHQTDATGRAG